MQSCKAKLDWAHVHLRRLVAEITDFRQAHPYTITHERDDTTPEYVF